MTDQNDTQQSDTPQERTILVHLNVTVPASDPRNADEIGDEIGAAIEVGMEGAPSGSTASGGTGAIVITLAEEV